MIQTLSVMLSFVRTFIAEEVAQDGFEYLLVVGGVSVAIIAAMVAVPGLMPAVIDGVCAAMVTVVATLTCP